MKILVINAGSSSVKFSLLKSDDFSLLAKGMVERIGLDGTYFNYTNIHNKTKEENVFISNTTEAVGLFFNILTDPKYGVLSSKEEISAIGHRVVHGGESITKPVLISQEIKDIIEKNFELAPLHNPPNLRGIEACEKNAPHIPQIAIFDTAFHSTMPEHSYLYGLPYSFYEDFHIRKYGFHGISHKYVFEESVKFLGRSKDNYNSITCHLGNGCSITAVSNGKSLDTSMGLTPLEGLIMGTRCGDIDPAIIFYLIENRNMSITEIKETLNKESGLSGLSEGKSGDLRDILDARSKGSSRAKLAVDAFTYRVKKYIAGYFATLTRVDSIVFTAGIGENSPEIREEICQGIEKFGIKLDKDKNNHPEACEIQSNDSEVKILVFPTNEEKEIAKQVIAVLGQKI